MSTERGAFNGLLVGAVFIVEGRRGLTCTDGWVPLSQVQKAVRHIGFTRQSHPRLAPLLRCGSWVEDTVVRDSRTWERRLESDARDFPDDNDPRSLRHLKIHNREAYEAKKQAHELEAEWTTVELTLLDGSKAYISEREAFGLLGLHCAGLPPYNPFQPPHDGG